MSFNDFLKSLNDEQKNHFSAIFKKGISEIKSQMDAMGLAIHTKNRIIGNVREKYQNYLMNGMKPEEAIMQCKVSEGFW